MSLFLMLTALCLCSHAQSRIEIIGTDTSAIIPIQQLRMANAKFVELKGCKEENDSLYSQTRSYQGLTNNLRSAILDLKTANQVNQKLIDDKQSIIALQDKQLVKNKRQIKWLKIQRWGAFAGIVLLTGKIIL